MAQKRDCGFALLYFLIFIFPLLLLGGFVALDLAHYNADTAAIQNALDEAGMQAAKYLPYRVNAEQASKRYLAIKYPGLFGERAENASVSATGSTIKLAYSGGSSIFFGPLLKVLAGKGGDLQVPVMSASKALLTPFDVTIVLDASSYMSPPLTASAGWGDPARWPAADFFRTSYTAYANGVPVDPAVATQQCFSPALWAAKRAVISAYSYFSSFDYDQAGVGVYPGLDAEVDFLRRTRTLNDVEGTDARNGAEAQLPRYGSWDKSDWLCTAAFEREQSATGYKLPAAAPGLDEWKAPPSRPAYMTVPPDYSFDPSYTRFVSLKQAVWGTVSRHMVADFPTVLQYTVTSLLTAPAVNTRRNLDGRKVRYGVLFAGSLPYASGVRWHAGNSADAKLGETFRSLTNLVESALPGRDTKVKLYYILFDHEGTVAAPVGLAVPALEDLIRRNTSINGIPSGKFEVALLYLNDPAVLNRDLLPVLLSGQRSVTLSY